MSISSGKYQPTFYNKDLSFQGSVCGGIFTLVLGLALLSITMVTFVNIFSKKHYNLNRSAVYISSYLRESDNPYTLTNERRPCSQCEDISVKDFLDLIGEFTYHIDISGRNNTKLYTC